MDEVYHVLNRGVDKRDIFKGKADYFRFIHDLYEFNDKQCIGTTYRAYQKNVKLYDIECRTMKRERELLVENHAFCLMPNHYHICLSPLEIDSIPTYMHKINMGYSKYFNIKNKRSGTLFEGRYKNILIENERQFSHILVYIHLNPLDLFMPEWRERGLNSQEINKCLKFLEDYRWSSHLDYLGKRNFPSVTQKDYFLKYFGGSEGYKNALVVWLKAPKFGRVKNLMLE